MPFTPLDLGIPNDPTTGDSLRDGGEKINNMFEELYINGGGGAGYDDTEIRALLEDKVDDSQVLTNVPLGAVFTDTIYDDTAIVQSLANKVNNSRVLTDVPAGALFTDTIYDDTQIREDIAAIDNNVTTEYHDSTQLGSKYVEAAFQEVAIPEFTDATFGGSHDLIYIKEVNKLFAFSRNLANNKIAVFNDVKNLSQYTIVDATLAGYVGAIEKASYDPTRKRILFSLLDNTYTKPNTIVRAIDVDTLAVSTIIDRATGTFAGAAVVEVVGNFIYTLEGNYNPWVNKYDLDGNFITKISSGLGNYGAHGLASDGKNLFVSTFINWYGTQKVTRVNLASFTVSQTMTFTFTGLPVPANGLGIFTNQIVLVGDYLYLGTEDLTPNKIYKVNKNNLTQFEIIPLMETQANSSVFFSALHKDKILYGGSKNLLSGIDIRTGRHSLYKNPFSRSVNQFSTDGERMFFAGHADNYPVNGTAIIGSCVYLQELKYSDLAPSTREDALESLIGTKVDNSRVLTNVPAGAVFTDTIYDDTQVQSDLDTIESALTALSTGKANTTHQHAVTDIVGLATELSEKVDSITASEPAGATTINNIVRLTQAQYDAGTPNANTMYLIV